MQRGTSTMLSKSYPTTRSKSNEKAIQFLAERGAHFVLCRENKAPLWAKWQKRAPSLDVAVAHLDMGPLGVVPWSIRASGLDVDFGSPDDLISEFPPLADCPTLRDGGHHLYYEDTEPRGNKVFDFYGCRGEVRGGSGYLILWTPEILAWSLDNPDPRAVKFPADLFEWAGLPATPRVSKVDRTATEIELEAIGPGRRNVSLFDAIRWPVYGWSKDKELVDWKARVRAFALEQNERFREPLAHNEVFWTAESISTWTWDGGEPIDHSTVAQRRRGVKRWHGDAKLSTLKAIRDRDESIVQAVLNGDPMRRVAVRFGLNLYAIQNIVCRDIPLFRPRRGKPPKNENIS